MKKINNIKDFVETVDASKKLNPKDLSSDQDLTIAIMNLISIYLRVELRQLSLKGKELRKNSKHLSLI